MRGTCGMWDDPFLYDLENADDPEFDLDFWSWLVESLGARRVLELACGTGRLTLPLARLGCEVVGVDSSAPFLARAAARLAQEPSGSGLDLRDRVRLVEGDMRWPEVEGPFDLVMVPFNSLAYLRDASGRAVALNAARSLLAPSSGRFAFDLLAPRYDLLAEAAGGLPVVRLDVDHAAGSMGVERFVRTSADTYDPATQTLHSVNRYELHYADGRVEHRIADLDWHIWFPSELELALAAAGLRVVSRYGGYGREPWGPGARRMLWVCAAA
jgi:SAM-dependent methyltransferase